MTQYGVSLTGIQYQRAGLVATEPGGRNGSVVDERHRRVKQAIAEEIAFSSFPLPGMAAPYARWSRRLVPCRCVYLFDGSAYGGAPGWHV